MRPAKCRPSRRIRARSESPTLLVIDKILAEAGFAAGPDALTSLTNALAAEQLANPAALPAVLDADEVVTTPTTISGAGKATLGAKS
jgi:flotillin